MTGYVASVQPERGFCFIAVDGRRENLFCHIKDCSADIEFDERLKGQRLVFDIVDDERSGKQRAANVRPAN